MAQGIAMENQTRSRNEASIMHNLRSLKMGVNNLLRSGTKSEFKDELSTQARLNIARERARRSEGSVARTAKAFQEVAKKRSIKEAVFQGVTLGLSLRKEMADGKFDAGTFYVVLFLSVLKDFADVLLIETLGVGGSIINVFVTIALIIVFLGKRSFMKKMLFKFFILIIVAEFIPLVNEFPFFIYGTIRFKMKTDQRLKDLAFQAEQVEEEVNQMQKKI